MALRKQYLRPDMDVQAVKPRVGLVLVQNDAAVGRQQRHTELGRDGRHATQEHPHVDSIKAQAK